MQIKNRPASPAVEECIWWETLTSTLVENFFLTLVFHGDEYEEQEEDFWIKKGPPFPFGGGGPLVLATTYSRTASRPHYHRRLSS